MALVVGRGWGRMMGPGSDFWRKASVIDQDRVRVPTIPLEDSISRFQEMLDGIPAKFQQNFRPNLGQIRHLLGKIGFQKIFPNADLTSDLTFPQNGAYSRHVGPYPNPIPKIKCPPSSNPPPEAQKPRGSLARRDRKGGKWDPGPMIRPPCLQQKAPLGAL